MWRLFNFLFGWDYIQWHNNADRGIARVFKDGAGRAVYWRYRMTNIMDIIRTEDQVFWLTCEPSKYMPAALRPQAVPMTEEQRREILAAGYVAAEQDASVCQLPPHGWHCTRKAGHEGPCAAVETNDAELVQRGMDRLREAHHGITAQGAQGGEG